MAFPTIELDGQIIDLDLDPYVTVLELISVIDQALLHSVRRVTSILGNGEELFTPERSKQLCTQFEALNVSSAEIPDFNRLKRAVVTLSIGEKYEKMRAVSEPTFKAYAKKCRADYICIDSFKLNLTDPHFEKWQMLELLFDYDRILFIDGDILVTPDAPDLFAMLPYSHLAGFYEDAFEDRSGIIKQSQKIMGDLGWSKGYLNSGVGLYSWLHRPLFRKPIGKYLVGPVVGEQDEYNYRIVKDGYKVCSLPYLFNHMEMNGRDFDQSYFIHYAGKGFTEGLEKDELYDAKVELMIKDWQKLSQRKEKDFCPPPLILFEGKYLELRPYLREDYLKPGTGTDLTDVTEEERFTLLPFNMTMPQKDGTLLKEVPMGDLLFSIPVAKAANMNIYIPRTFIGDLIYDLLEDKSSVVRDLSTKNPVCQIVNHLVDLKESALHTRKWGAPELSEKFGYINVSETLAAAIGITLEDPGFHLRRPAEEVPGRVIIFPTGSTPQRSLISSYTEQLKSYLEFKGYEVLMGDQRFKDHRQFAEFVASAEYIVSVATGPQHLAAAMGIKTVGLCVASSDWGYKAKEDHVRLLKTSCSRCWFEDSKEWLCGEQLPLCMRENTPVNVLIAMKELDQIQAKKEAGELPAS